MYLHAIVFQRFVWTDQCIEHWNGEWEWMDDFVGRGRGERGRLGCFEEGRGREEGIASFMDHWKWQGGGGGGRQGQGKLVNDPSPHPPSPSSFFVLLILLFWLEWGHPATLHPINIYNYFKRILLWCVQHIHVLHCMYIFVCNACTFVHK